MKKKIKFAVLVDGDHLKKWQIECIKQLQLDAHNDFVFFIKPSHTKPYSSSKLSLGFRYLEKKTRQHSLFQNQPYKKEFPAIPFLTVNTYTKGIKTHVASDDLEGIKSLELDFILRFGFGIIGGGLLKAAKHGVWSFHHGDPTKYRGGPACFWEFLKGEKSNGFILQKLNEQLDAGEIIIEGNLALWQHSFLEHQARVFQLSIVLPRIASKRLSIHQRLDSKPILKKGKLYKAPNNFDVFKFYFKQLAGKIHFHYIQLFKSETWNVGIAHQLKRINSKTHVADINWMPKPKKGTYYADPFWLNDNTIFYEEYDYKTLKANISKATYEGKTWQIHADKGLNKEYHLSYPFVIHSNGNSYMLPEQYKSNSIDLYHLISDRIEFKCSLLKGAWVDPTLLFYQNKWWLFASPQSYSNECLHIFYADKLEGPYTEHPLNPVKIDITSARPGGTPFMQDGKLIRPSQNSINGYGSSLKLNYIKTLSETEFIEECVDEIFPDQSSEYKEALHTLSKRNNTYLIDGKKTHFVLNSFLSQFKRKLKNFI